MSIYKRGEVFWYDFWIAGRRFVRSCKTRDMAEAERVEAEAKGRFEAALPQIKRNMTEPGVYFLLAAKCGVIKIGCSGNITVRVDDIQASSPEPLRLVGKIETDRFVQAERALHELFQDKHRRNEWFEIDERDVAFAIDYWERVKDKPYAYRSEAAQLDFNRFYSAAEVAYLLSMSIGFIRKAIQSGKIEHVKIGTAVRIRGSEIKNFLAKRGAPDCGNFAGVPRQTQSSEFCEGATND